MGKISLDSNHYFFTSTQEVRKICNPLFEKQQISFFDYARFYKNGDFYGLTVNSDAFKIYFDLEYESFSFCKNFSYEFETDKYYYFLTTLSQSEYLSKVFKTTTSDHGFIIFKKNNSYVDTFYFSSPYPAHHAMNLYLNQLPIFIKFISYFQNTAAKLLINASENRIVLPHKMLPKLWNSTDKNTFLNDEPLGCEKHAKLSKRESECLKYFCQGYTIKDIANILHLSSRTIETYLLNIKLKFNIRKKSQLIQYMHSQDSI